MKTKNSKKSKISKSLLKKWENCEDIADVNKLLVAEIRSLCEHFGIKSEGKKADLSKRLWKNCSDESDDDETDDDDDDDETDDEESDEE